MYKTGRRAQSRLMEANQLPAKSTADGLPHPMKVRNAPLSLPGQPALTLIRRSTMKHILIAAALLTGLIATGFGQSQEERREDGKDHSLPCNQERLVIQTHRP